MDEEKILALLTRHEEAGLDAALAHYGGRLRALAAGIVGAEAAEECVNDALLAAWNAIPPKRPAVLSAFLGKITRNLALDCWKLQHAEKRGSGSVALALDELAECIPSGGGLERALDEKELSSTLDAFLRTLPERECSVFLRRYWYSDSVRDVARRFAMNENSTKSMLFRTREKLRKYLEGEGIAI